MFEEGRHKTRFRVFLWAALVFSMVTVSVAAPIDDARFKGLAWLMSQQNGDGSWRGTPGLEVAATASAVEALVNAGVTKGDAYATAVAWLQNHPAYSTDALARQIVALHKAGRDASVLVTRLIAWRNDTSLSWGAYDHYSGSFPDSSLAMDAIKITGTPYVEAGYSIGFIINKQNTDGGWPYVKEDVGTPPSKVIPTAHNLLTLNRYKTAFGVQSNIDTAIAWLKAQQKTGGGFGEGTAGTVLETALAYRALVAELGSADPAAINAQNFLVGQQEADGGWGGNDALLTPLILAAFPPTVLADADSDGLPDGVETPALLGTNPSVPDGRLLAKGNGRSITGLTTPTQLPPATLYQAYTATAGASGGTPPYAWSLLSGALPDGLSLNASTGEISGTPASVGAFNFIYRVASATTQTDVKAQIEVLLPAAQASTAVPTLPEEGMILMGVLLALIFLHRQRQSSRRLR